ncbi:hypothetical protein [Marivita sp. GX14005]|uniref:hypothetical protein n=1 Tax=Marivita sp. GX14005 TaxID=2942276 RepID=UPI00201A21F9|nr:hypothetical protein [Marivita sp. GX14005]MCL3882943.1 hypothetical protein [Marivita sp. GX14005]
MPAAKSLPLNDLQQQALDAAQVMFSMNPAYAPQVTHFWEAQDLMLKEAEKFASSWFERRHEATQSALKAATDADNTDLRHPAVAMQAMLDWQKNSMERMAEDLSEWSAMMSRCAGIWTSNETEAMEETEANAKRTAKPAKSTAL